MAELGVADRAKETAAMTDVNHGITIEGVGTSTLTFRAIPARSLLGSRATLDITVADEGNVMHCRYLAWLSIPEHEARAFLTAAAVSKPLTGIGAAWTSGQQRRPVAFSVGGLVSEAVKIGLSSAPVILRGDEISDPPAVALFARHRTGAFRADRG
jgi:hypothetical protein